MLKLKIFALFVLMTPLFISAQLPAGAIAKYELNTNATDFGGNSYNGTLTSTSNTTNRFGTANSALAFTAGVSTGTLPLALATAMQNDFSLGYWFKTSMTANSGGQWYNGNALVDAEVCGGTNDWGTALIDGGKVCFGIGNTDITIKSVSASYNNGNWHFVTATRNAGAGTIILYVDGVSVASTSGTNPGALNAPNLIGLARNPCVTGGAFTGSLDDIIAYNRVLTATEVNNLYVFLNAFTLPVKWLSFTGELAGKNIVLTWEVEQAVSNDHFEIENSRDGIHFSVEGIIYSKDAVPAGAGRELYRFSSVNPPGGTYFYRIRQVDKDGMYSYSKTIKMTVRNAVPGIWLQTNPVANELVLVNNHQAIIQRVQVADMSGRVISDKPVSTNNALIKLNSYNLLPGFYLLRVFTANGNSTLPLIKQ